MQRVHIQFGEHRTTVSLDKMLSALLAIKLGQVPESSDGKRAVREWLQARLPAKVGTGRGLGKRASQYARQMMIEAIADTKISQAYGDWLVSSG